MDPHLDILRCWTTLGLVVRIGQSIGLHVEDDPMRMTQTFGAVEREMRRRTWYCTYVLDRLLSLQLGRPSAIRNRDYTVQLPSRLDDARFDVEADCIPAPGDGPQAGDYFLSVIQFSHVVGHVMRDLYRPSMLRSADLLLATIDRLDGDILQWRSQLPRTLRFDLGHAFEKSITLKRQVSIPFLILQKYILTILAEYARHKISSSACFNPSIASLPSMASRWRLRPCMSIRRRSPSRQSLGTDMRVRGARDGSSVTQCYR